MTADPNEMRIPMDDGAVLRAGIHDGAGPTVMLLHDLDCSGAYWNAVIERLLQLDADLRVIDVDLRGHGASTMVEEPSRKRLVKDVKRLCKELGVAEPVLCGHGWGADVALACDFAGAVVAINPRMGRADSVAIEGDFTPPPGMSGAQDPTVLASCEQGLLASKVLRRSRRDAPLLLAYATPADAQALEGSDVLEHAVEVFAVQEGSRHLPIEMPMGMAALLYSWIEEVA